MPNKKRRNKIPSGRTTTAAQTGGRTPTTQVVAQPGPSRNPSVSPGTVGSPRSVAQQTTIGGQGPVPTRVVEPGRTAQPRTPAETTARGQDEAARTAQAQRGLDPDQLPDLADPGADARDLDAGDLREEAEGDRLREEINQQVARMGVPDELDTLSPYLDPGDLDTYRNQHASVADAVARLVTAGDRAEAERQVTAIRDAAVELQGKAAAALVESKSFGTEINQRVATFTDLTTQVADLADYLDGSELAGFLDNHNAATTALTNTAAKPRIAQADRDAVLQQASTVTDAATALTKQGTAARVVSDGWRTVLGERAAGLAGLRAAVDAWAPFLAEADRAAFAEQLAAVEQRLTAASAPKRVLELPYRNALLTFADAWTRSESLVKKANAGMAAKLQRERAALTALRKEARQMDSFDLTVLNGLNTAVTDAVEAGDWAQVDAKLDAMHDESAKINSFLEGLGTSLDRIAKLPDKINNVKLDKPKMRQELFNPFKVAVTKMPRDDAQVVHLLGLLKNAIQQQEDKVALGAAGAAAREALRAQGLLSGRGREIKETSRATVGATEAERAVVIEALDALEDSSLAPDWAAKWGAYHGNAEGNLPGILGGGGYREYYVRPVPGGANILRLVKHNTTGRVYYSPNHYGSSGPGAPFVKVTDP